MTEQPPEPPKRPLAEAAAMLGKTTEAVRSMVRRGRLAAVRGNNGKLLVAVPPELVRADDRSDPVARPDGDQLVRLLAERDEALLEADHLRELLTKARVAQAGTQARLEAETGAKDALIAELRTMLAELRAALAEARRPWWRRWRG